MFTVGTRAAVNSGKRAGGVLVETLVLTSGGTGFVTDMVLADPIFAYTPVLYTICHYYCCMISSLVMPPPQAKAGWMLWGET